MFGMAVPRLPRFWSASRTYSRRNLLIVNCIVLAVNLIFYVLNSCLIFTSLWLPPESYFLSPLEPEDKDLLNTTFRTFIDAMLSNNLTFFIFSGTLIGSIRHHAMIPWDDDIDVMINASDRDRVQRALTLIDPKSFGLRTWLTNSNQYVYHWKFYPLQGRRILDKDFRSPSMDVFFYAENETHIWNASPRFSKKEVWPKSHVFPLQRRPFGNLMVPAPCNAEGFLGHNFNISECRSRAHSHIYDKPLPFRSVVVPCERLTHLYPFVHRVVQPPDRSGNQGVVELLVYRNTTLREFKHRGSC